VGIVAEVIGELVLPCWEEVLKAVRESDIVVCSALARPMGWAVAEKAGKKMAVVNLQPTMPTASFPHFSAATEAVRAIVENGPGKEIFEEWYWELEKFQFDFLADRLRSLLKKMEIPEMTFEDWKSHSKGENEKTLMVNAFSNEVVPLAKDAGSYTVNVGPLADRYIPEGWAPLGDLVAFIESGAEPPVCIGFGSMPFGGASVISEALKQCNLRAVLVGDALKDVNFERQHSVFHISSVPYTWLLPQCLMMFSHGGAGVVNASLAAGIPSLISPLMGDQFFWAKLLEAKGYGVACGSSLTTLTKDEMTEAIESARSCIPACKKLASSIQDSLSGSVVLPRIFDDFLGKPSDFVAP